MSTKSTIDLEYLRAIKAIVYLQGREYLTHAGLLRVAHEHGIASITTDLVSWDAAQQAAVVKATATGERGTYTGYGDCDTKNTKLRGACLRMAETRAINRALRLYTGLGMTTTEEMPGDEPRRGGLHEAPDIEARSWVASVAHMFKVSTGQIEAILAEAGRDWREIPMDKRGAAESWLRERVGAK